MLTEPEQSILISAPVQHILTFSIGNNFFI